MLDDNGARPVYASDKCEIDLGRRELRVLGSSVPIGGRAFEMIEVLARSSGELVTKDELMSRVWPGAIVGESTLQVHISALRKALGPCRALLKTESGRGYRLTGGWQVRWDSERLPSNQHEPMPMPVADQRFATNFPERAFNLVGRTDAARHLRDVLSAYRVVTLSGPGGIGKTSLAVEVARDLLPDFQGEGWLVELGSLSDPTLVPSAVAGILGLRTGGEIVAASVARAIGDKRLLLVLDNCEHVITAAAELTENVVRHCPQVTILATSREALRIEGEYVYRVPPLEVPPLDTTAPDDILAHGAVRLFVSRTSALQSDFAPSPDDLPVIVSICRHLDGIPLAIEFAAARAAMLGLQPVAAGLRDRFALLTSGRRTALPRHRTLRAAFDWGHELLPEAERVVFRRLAVFAGGFTLAAATAVMNDTGLDAAAITDGIANLAARSLLVLDRSEGPARWYLLETTRAYAQEKLTQHDQADLAARCHAAYFRDQFRPPASGLATRLSEEELKRHVREVDNVRAALDWAFSPVGNATIGVELVAAYAPVWQHLSLTTECRDRCERALHSLESEARPNVWLRMWLRIVLGNTIMSTMGPSEHARTILASALEDGDALNDLTGQARALSGLSAVHVHRGEYGAARRRVERLRRIADQIGDPDIAGLADRMMGNTLLTLGRPREAQECLENVLRHHPGLTGEQRNSVWRHTEYRAMARAMLARSLWMQGFADKAWREAQASLEELRETDPQLALCRVLYFGVCRIAPMLGDFVTAEREIARLIELATRLHASFWQTSGRFLQGKLLVEQRDYAPATAILREAFHTCGQTGWRMSYPEFKGALAQSLAGMGEFDAAREAVDDAIASAGGREDGQVWYLAELLRIKGEILLRQGADRSMSTAAAEDCFDQAREIAREQGALFWELRVALSIARARHAEGRHREARQILLPVYNRFTEGFTTADLSAARALLDQS
jgi:predicted ATPase/DNA-binding winged helix-turn-helix (wHTH) protein